MILEYQLDWTKIIDFLLIASFWSMELFYETPSSLVGQHCFLIFGWKATESLTSYEG